MQRVFDREQSEAFVDGLIRSTQAPEEVEMLVEAENLRTFDMTPSLANTRCCKG